MLKELRKKKTAKKIWIILTVLILPAFLFWGFGSFIRSRQETSYAGRISGRNVPLLEYKDALNAARNQAIIQFGDNISELENKINLGALAWNRLILLTEAKRRKVNVSDREVIDLIRSYAFFQRKGDFDGRIYAQMLQYVFRTQPRIFEEETRQNLMISKLYKEITGNLNLSEEEAGKEYLKLNEQVSIYYIAGLTADFMKDIAAPEKEVKDYFSRNSLQFKEPLSFNMEYVSLAPEGKNESAARDRIKALALRLSKKEGFSAAAKELNLKVQETGLFSQTDPVPGIGWSPQILSLISRLKTGESSGPVYMDGYYYILRLKDRKEPYIPDFETIKDKVSEAFIKEAAGRTAKQKIEGCLKEIRAMQKANPKSADFSRIAKDYGLKADSTGLFKYGSYIEGIGSSDLFFELAGALKEDDTSGIIETPSGFYIVKLKLKVPVDEKVFAEEKPEFTKKLLLQKREEYFSAFVEGLRKKAQITGY